MFWKSREAAYFIQYIYQAWCFLVQINLSNKAARCTETSLL